ncbi:DUF2034 domain-containing protein [Streptomyces sp. NPDC002817]|uniref:DUF2034 domain-containing protein n=1 Tax=Streptomyces sp. NPDC088357 TaxID=3154655 RepID=UPI0034399A76
MINESALLESKSLRDSVLERTDVLDRVKGLSLLPDGMHVTTAMMAAYFCVTVEVIRQLTKRHREELEVNGMAVLRGADLRKFENDNMSLSLGSYPQARRSLTIYSRRAILNVAMLLRDSDVARQVRTDLLDMEYLTRTLPAEAPAPTAPVAPDNLDARIDQRITHILGKTVVPMFNALIETSGEHRSELIALRTGVQRIERRLQQHHARLQRLESPHNDRPLAGVMAAMDAMTGRRFEYHIAELLRRDGCTNIAVQGGRGDRGVDISALTADGRRLAGEVECRGPTERPGPVAA